MEKKVPVFQCTQPCSNCPYRTDAPVKHWHKSEFQKLLDDETAFIGHAYNCHKNNGSICVGWLMKQVEADYPSIAGRIQLNKNKVSVSYLNSLHSPAPLYKSLQEMIRANYPQLLKIKI